MAARWIHAVLFPPLLVLWWWEVDAEDWIKSENVSDHLSQTVCPSPVAESTRMEGER